MSLVDLYEKIETLNKKIRNEMDILVSGEEAFWDDIIDYAIQELGVDSDNINDSMIKDVYIKHLLGRN